ncbi:MAG: helix-turn-helix domain-containing protein [Acidimicrobiia bacterium]|nr:helix-turn-helix domain-containing protein [Acidimicrobiia bacterium]
MPADLPYSDPFESYGEQMTVADVAEALNLTDKAVTAQARDGRIPGAVKLGSGPKARWRFNRTMLSHWYRKQMEESIQRFQEHQKASE